MELPWLRLSVFQSPCGELSIGKLQRIANSQSTEKFQSPCGELSIGKFIADVISVDDPDVSIPLRGIKHWKVGWGSNLQSIKEGRVSIPLRGIKHWKVDIRDEK